jgi:hypothetical protein
VKNKFYAISTHERNNFHYRQQSRIGLIEKFTGNLLEKLLDIFLEICYPKKG